MLLESLYAAQAVYISPRGRDAHESELEYMRNEPSQKIVRLVTDLAAI